MLRAEDAAPAPGFYLAGETIVVFWKKGGWYGKRYYHQHGENSQTIVLSPPFAYGATAAASAVVASSSSLPSSSSSMRCLQLDLPWEETELGKREAVAMAAAAEVGTTARSNTKEPPYYLFSTRKTHHKSKDPKYHPFVGLLLPSLDTALASSIPPARMYYHPTTMVPVSIGEWMLSQHSAISSLSQQQQLQNQSWRLEHGRAVR